MYHMILVRFGEMTLKKANYKQFLKQMINNIKNKLKVFPKLSFENTAYRFYIHLNGEDENKVMEALNTVVGIHSYSLCIRTTKDLDDIASVAVLALKEQLKEARLSFKVETNRADKAYPLNSIQISQEVAKRILPQIANLYVDVHKPDILLAIDLRYEGTYIYTQTIKGLGGYPSSIAGRALVMISGGIDSPVAGYLAIRKGLSLEAIHFASYPYTSALALQKVVKLLERLSHYTNDAKIILHVVSFTDIQLEIKDKINLSYIMTLMRRSMLRIAAKLALDRGLDAIINGESVGQVASQTIESMMVVNEVTNLPVIRPLATHDKEDIVKIAKDIKTFDISIEPYEDCCTIFVPKHPIIKPKLKLTLLEEAKTNILQLEEEALTNITTYKISYKKPTIIEDYQTYEI